MRKIPGPSALSLFLMNPLARDDYHNLEYLIDLTRDYGDIFRLTGQIVLTGPKAFEHVLKTRRNNYTKDHSFYRRLASFFDKSLLVTEGEEWRVRRKMANPTFHPQKIPTYAPVIIQKTQELGQLWREKSSKSIEVFSEMSRLTLFIALQLFAGEPIDNTTLGKIQRAISIGNRHINHSLVIAPWFFSPGNLRFYWNKRILDKILLELIQKRRLQYRCPAHLSSTALPSIENKDLLQELLIAKGENNNFLENPAILAEFKTLLITGHETTASGLAWMWYLLAEHPEHRTLLEEEIDEVLGGRSPTPEDLDNMPWLHATIKETFRLYPPIWSVMRKAIEEDEIDNYHIPAKANLMLSLYALHRNPQYWDCPKIFYPARFLKENSIHRHPFAFLPFIAGARSCIAANLGMIEAMLIAATMIQQFRLEKINDKVVHPEACVSLRPRDGIRLRITARKQKE